MKKVLRVGEGIAVIRNVDRSAAAMNNGCVR